MQYSFYCSQHPEKAKPLIALPVSVNDLESEAIREQRRFFLKRFSLREPHLLTLLRFF